MSTRSIPLRVLVVDDDRVITDTLVTILSARRYRVRAAYSAEDAIAEAAQFMPDALITDIVMPGKDGHELAAYFAEHHPACKVMLMSDGLSGGGPQLLKSVRRILDFLGAFGVS